MKRRLLSSKTFGAGVLHLFERLLRHRARDLLPVSVSRVDHGNPAGYLTVRTRAHMNSGDSTDPPSSGGTRIDCRLDRSNLAADYRCDQAGVDFFVADQPDICGFHHGV